MLRILRRIELLEEALLPVEQVPLFLPLRINFVERDGTVVDTLSTGITVHPPPSRNGGGRATRRSWPARRLS
jgi:hypothetical protein